MKWKRHLKQTILGRGRKSRKIPFGMYRGLVLSIDSNCETMLFLGLYERETYSWLIKAGADAQSGIDVGAGTGELTIWLTRQKKMRQVSSFEPDSQRWPIFEQNLASNTIDSSIQLKLARRPFKGAEAVEILKKAPEPILLKIDIDGGEYELLQTLKDELRQKNVRILLEVHSLELNEKCLKFLKEAGYQANQISKAWWRCLLPETRPSPFNQWIVAIKN